MLSSPDWKLDFGDQPPNVPTLPNHQVSLQCPTTQVSLQCPTTKYPCSAQKMSIPAMLNGCAQPQSIPAVPNHASILTLPNRRVSLQCPTTQVSLQSPTAKYPCSPNCRVSLQCPTTAGPNEKWIPAVPKRRVSLECPTAQYQYSCSAFAVLQGRQFRGGRETLHFLCNNGFRVVMLEVCVFF